MPSEYTDKEKDAALVNQWRTYAEACQKHGTPGIVQACHPGRQSPRPAGRRGIFGQPIAPSAIPLRLGEGYFDQCISAMAFASPREMTQADIDTAIRQFVDAARLMADSGFSGIELHGAHGYLLGMILCLLYLEGCPILTFLDQFLNVKVPHHRVSFVTVTNAPADKSTYRCLRRNTRKKGKDSRGYCD